MAAGMVAAPPCLARGSQSARIELVGLGELPAEWEQWGNRRQGFFLSHREPERWHLIFKGVATENGYMEAYPKLSLKKYSPTAAR